MRKHLNTLFVTTQGAYLSKEGETVVVRVDGETRLQVPVHTLGGIVCFGNVGVSPFLMGFCSERDVRISFLSEHGRFLAKVQGAVSGNVLLRREQYRKADNKDFSAGIARSVLAGKIANSRTVLQRALRDHEDKIAAEDVRRAVQRLNNCLDAVDRSDDLDALRGIEGDAARIYFNVFDHLIVAQKDSFTFQERNRRPPLDNVNCLLSFIYTLVMHDVRSALETVGIDPAVGFLHRDRPGRPGCALDLMEEFRPFIADRLALSLINLRKVGEADFRRSEAGAVTISDDARKTLLVAYQERKREEILHPFIGEKMTVGILFFMQSLLLARHLRGELDGYPPFIWK
ncbi:MAG: type I-C CRISPR-associated endonuclease Cas1c [Syntrophales bacterium]